MPDTKSVPARALPWITWALTFHILVVALLFGLLHLPTIAVRGIAAWKEIAGVLLFGAVIGRMLLNRGPRVRIAAADLFAGGWAALAIVFALTENVVFRESVPPTAALLGVRDAAYFVVFYFIGRATPEIADEGLFRRAFWVLLVTSGIAVLEQLFVTPEMLMVIGVGSYVNDFLGTEVFTRGNMYGLPDNYWSQMGSHLVRRSGSVFLSSQGFAMIFLVLLPAATIWALDPRARNSRLRRAGYVLIWAGLLATFTRAAIFVGTLQLIAFLAFRYRSTGIALAGAAGLLLFVGGIFAIPGLATFVFESLTWQSGSSASHLKDYQNGIVAFFTQPWGNGLGTTDQTAVRAGLTPLTADNLYLKYAVELGVVGLILVTGTLTAFAAAGLRLVRTVTDAIPRDLGLVVLLATCGVALYGMTSTIFNDPIVSYLLFWFAGAAVTHAQRAVHRVERRIPSGLPAHA